MERTEEQILAELEKLELKKPGKMAKFWFVIDKLVAVSSILGLYGFIQFVYTTLQGGK
jgi:hypothetical protein